MSGHFGVCFCCTRKFKLRKREPPDEIGKIFEEFSEGGTMSVDDLREFLINFQGERGTTLDDAQRIIHHFKHHGIIHHHGLNLKAFYHYLISDENSPLPLSRKVHHDMSAPLSHYFMYTGHNSYLTGNQLSSDSSAEPVKKALRRGVRVIELDLWPDASGRHVEVCHGGTLTSSVDLQKCLNTIKDNAFYASDYPVVITFEDHLSPKLQDKAAKMVGRTFGKMLFRSKSAIMTNFPSPESLKNKILISTKPPKVHALGDEVEEERTKRNGSSGSRKSTEHGHAMDEDGETVAPKYRDLIAIHAGKPKGGPKGWLSDDPKVVRRVSMSEQELENSVRTNAADIVRFTQRNLLRIYPKGSRLDSSNYDPFVGWTHGAQMVAFNMQGHGRHLWEMQGMFRANGGCGYVRKPAFLLSNSFNPRFTYPIQTILKVKVITGEGWDADFSLKHFDRYSPPDFFVGVGIVGARGDTSEMYTTRVTEDEWAPVWNEEFEFPIRLPELALLMMEVTDFDTSSKHDFGGQTCLPLPELGTGVRAVRLCNRRGDVFKHARLLVHLQFYPPYNFRI